MSGSMLFANLTIFNLMAQVLMDGWMTCNFMSFSTVFQSYQDDKQLIMKAVCNGIPFTVEKILPLAGIKLTTA